LRRGVVKKNKKNRTTHALTADALYLLASDHRFIEDLFARYRAMAPVPAHAAQRELLAEEICLALTIQLRLEQELFYPAAREALDDADAVEDCESGQDRLRDMVAQVLATRFADPLFDARLAVLEGYVASHIRQQREQLFPAVSSAPLDLHALGLRLAARKDELHAVAEALREDALAGALTT